MDGFNDKKVEIMRKYLPQIASTNSNYYIKGEIPLDKMDNAIKSFAPGLDRSTIIGLYDITFWGSCKNGYIFTYDKIIYFDLWGKPQKMWYDDILALDRIDMDKKDNERGLRVHLRDRSTVTITSYDLNKTPLRDFLDIMKEFDQKAKMSKQSINYKSPFNPAPDAGGLGFGAYKQINKQYDEEKFHASNGHDKLQVKVKRIFV